ncbi:2-aminoethylphosphonate--pyruvate transaminase [Enterococcus sp. LJL98]
MTYKLLTPGPLTTSETVKAAMQVDHCTWDQDYKEITQAIRQELLRLAQVNDQDYTTILMQGSGTFGVESVISSMVLAKDHLLICANGAYGRRLQEMAEQANLRYTLYEVAENQIPDAEAIRRIVAAEPTISALAMVHSETTSGILNDLDSVAAIAKEKNLLFIVDAMSSFGGIPLDVGQLGIDFLVSSSNKCIQGVPGFSFVLAKKEELVARKGHARSLSLDLYAQYEEMARDGKWRFTSPTHTVLAFQQALKELSDEGGIVARYQRYAANNHLLRTEMAKLGYQTVITEHQGPFITSFYYPETGNFDFQHFYEALKANGFVIYPGKISDSDCFRIGNIGEIYQADIEALLQVIKTYTEENHDN